MLTVVAVAVAAGFVLWMFGEHIPRTMAIFLIAAFIAFGVRPVVLVLENRKVPKALAITIVYVALFLIAAVGLIIVVPLTVEQAQALLVRFPDYSNALTELGGVVGRLRPSALPVDPAAPGHHQPFGDTRQPGDAAWPRVPWRRLRASR